MTWASLILTGYAVGLASGYIGWLLGRGVNKQ